MSTPRNTRPSARPPAAARPSGRGIAGTVFGAVVSALRWFVIALVALVGLSASFDRGAFDQSRMLLVLLGIGLGYVLSKVRS